jgi:hypothetical protein
MTRQQNVTAINSSMQIKNPKIWTLGATAGKTKRIGRRITGQNRGFPERDTKEQTIVSKRPQSAIHKAQSGDISDPNNYVHT